MHRFWFFPLVLALVAVPFPQLTYLEALFPMVMLDGMPGHVPTVMMTLSDLGEIWNFAASYSVIMGVLLGVGLALFDLLRNRHRPGSEMASSLLGNLWWCGLYVTAINALNTLLCLGVAKAFPGPHAWSKQTIVPLFMVGILNLSAVLWASIRSITSGDVLSPGVLRDKLRRSVHLTG